MSTTPLMSTSPATFLSDSGTTIKGPSSVSASASGTIVASSMNDDTGVLDLGKTRLVLGDEELRVVGGGDEAPGKSRGCCGGLLSCGSGSKGVDTAATVIKLHNVLWAGVKDSTLTINYAHPTSKSKVISQTLSIHISSQQISQATAWAARCMSFAYGSALPQKRLKILINPFGGQGNAVSLFEKHCKPLFYAANCSLDIHTTQRQGEAIGIARDLDIDKYDAVVCASGDGIPHEVFNGFGERADARRALAKVAVAQLPCGSGNGMCLNLTGTSSPSIATVEIIKGVVKPMDLVSVTQDGTRRLSFLSQSFGIVAEADLGTEHLRWLGGDLRFLWGMLSRIQRQAVYPCELAVKVSIDTKDGIRQHYTKNTSEAALIEGNSPREDFSDSDPKNPSTTIETTSLSSPNPFSATISSSDLLDDLELGLPPLRYGTITDPLPENWDLVPHPTMGNFYAGNMCWMSAEAKFFPASLPDEGLFDLISIDGKIPRLTSLKTLAAAATGGHWEMEHVLYRKVEAYRIIPIVEGKKGVDGKGANGDGYISVDGERIPFKPFQAEVHKALGRVLGRQGNKWENCGV